MAVNGGTLRAGRWVDNASAMDGNALVISGGVRVICCTVVETRPATHDSA
jgi:hypothetical protein